LKAANDQDQTLALNCPPYLPQQELHKARSPDHRNSHVIVTDKLRLDCAAMKTIGNAPKRPFATTDAWLYDEPLFGMATLVFRL